MSQQLHPSLQLPILDISQPLNLSSLSSLYQACQDWGFFHIINHGISKDLIKSCLSFSKHLFNLSSTSKLKLGPSSSIKTYTPPFIASPIFEGLQIRGPDFAASASSSTGVLFGQPKSEFCDIVDEYGSKMMEICNRIMLILFMTLDVGFEKKHYESEFNGCHGYLRINNYTRPFINKDYEVEGLGMHTDMSCITILYQDEAGGLQVRSKEGHWMDLEPCEGTLVVNIGDMLQAWSNGRFRSSEHRVVLRGVENRLSMAFFWCFDDDKLIWAPQEVVGEGNPRIYRPFICLDYLKFREDMSVKEEFEKVGFTVNDFALV